MSVEAEASSSVEAEDTVSTISPTAASKFICQLDHVVLALPCRDPILLGLGFGFRAGLLLRLDLEGLHRLRHVANFIAAAEARQDDREIAVGKFAHSGAKAR